MEKLLPFIDQLCLDEQLYWRVPLLAGGEAEIRWQRHCRPLNWTVRTGDGSFHRDVTSKDLVATIQMAGVDQRCFQQQLSGSVLAQAAFAQLVKDEVTHIFGADVVDRSIADTQNFLHHLGQMTSELVSPETAVYAPAKPARGLRLLRS